MKTIGLIGGMSWESTTDYYKNINTFVRERVGGLSSAKIALYSVNFEEIEKLQHKGMWDETASILSEAAKKVESAGADFFLICTNTMHKVADTVEESVNIPLVHIADATAKELQKNNIKKAGLLGTSFTMEQDFYKGRLSEKFGIEIVIPEKSDVKVVHDVIYNELCLGKVLDHSREEYKRICRFFSDSGCECVILGCTEIGILLKQSDVTIPLYDTTMIHAEEAVRRAVE